MSIAITYQELLREAGLARGTLKASATDYLDADSYQGSGELARLETYATNMLDMVYNHAKLNEGAEEHEWSFLRPLTTFTLWGSVAVDSDVTVTGTDAGGGMMTLTATAASFYETMEGKDIIITAVGTFEIMAYYSSTVIQIKNSTAVSAKTFSIAADGDYLLPKEFLSVIGDMTFIGTNGAYYPRIRNVHEGDILKARSGQEDLTGTPNRYATVANSSDGSQQQRWTLMVWPIPDSDYTAQYQCELSPDALTRNRPNPLGPPSMRMVYIQGMLSMAELHDNDMATTHHTALFQNLLQSAIRNDLKQHGAKSLGKMTGRRGKRYGGNGLSGCEDRNDVTYVGSS